MAAAEGGGAAAHPRSRRPADPAEQWQPPPVPTTRPPFPVRWEPQLLGALIGVALAIGEARRSRSPEPDRDWMPDEVRRARERQRLRDAEHPWVQQVARERSALRAATGLWLAWRSFQLERRSDRQT